MPSNNIDVKKMITVTQKKVDEMVNDITLTVHRRVVQVNNIPSHILSVLVQALMFHVPQSVQLNIKKVNFFFTSVLVSIVDTFLSYCC